MLSSKFIDITKCLPANPERSSFNFQQMWQHILYRTSLRANIAKPIKEILCNFNLKIIDIFSPFFSLLVFFSKMLQNMKIWIAVATVAMLGMCQAQLQPSEAYLHFTELDDDSKVRLYWKFDDGNITFEVSSLPL